MKQATGSKAPQAANKVSIQQSLDGHSFSAPALGGDFGNEGKVEVEILSACTMLVPRELFDASAAEAALAANGMYPSAAERVVWSDPEREVVAVMAVCKEAVEAVELKLGGRAAYTTPLLFEPAINQPTVWCMRAGGLLYIKVYEKALCFAEVVPVPADADLVYFFERLAGAFVLKNYTLLTAGDDVNVLHKQLKNRFKR